MLIYNVTTKVDWLVHDNWLKWMQEEHIPAVMATGCFEKHQLVRLLDTDETEGVTYAVQYYANGNVSYNRYIDLYQPAFREEAVDKWKARVISFHTLMQVVN
ncbi:protein of unknown function [Filimonas lacunae]|uniref:DUF4286 domain-containing protein n=1 Tax=Filimonas lacunae TaxID=477680 RepID=A0A173MQP6_9BACT|nr:DUF4286 family protein [Filimonas lacunae]BAV09974.1 hypothetical protein FLA_6027 [Filimonas lacunae]SIS81930.1 protein of unknown function [Filimonas lacunae]